MAFWIWLATGVNLLFTVTTWYLSRRIPPTVKDVCDANLRQVLEARDEWTNSNDKVIASVRDFRLKAEDSARAQEMRRLEKALEERDGKVRPEYRS